MKRTRYVTDEEVIDRAMKALLKSLGPVETARFINLRRAKRIESVKRHSQWQAKLKKDEFFDQVFNSRQ